MEGHQSATINISFGMIVLNGEPFIKYNLDVLYNHAHEILIVEGAVQKFSHAATPDGHSLDKTLEIIKSFPDPDDKIKLIQCDGFWSEKDEMCNAYMEVCTGDYIWQVDVDEFYKPEDIEKVRSLLIMEPDITRVDIKAINFWHGFRTVIQGASYIYGFDEFVRIFRFSPGLRYRTHRPPTLQDENCNEFFHTRVVTASELIERCSVYIYHYSYVFPEYVRGKAEYYARMNWGGGHENGLAWYQKNWIIVSNPLRIHIIKYPPSWIVPFEGTHPHIIDSLRNDISYNDDPEYIEFIKQDFVKYKKVGESLAQHILNVTNKKISRFRAFYLCFSSLIFPTSLRDVRADLTILQTSIRLLCR